MNIKVESFVEPNNYHHHNAPPLQGYIYQNVLPLNLLSRLKKEMKYIIDRPDKNTFMSRAHIHHVREKKVYEGVNLLAKRYQDVLFDLTYLPDYWYQTNDTLTDWAYNYIKNNVSPMFVKYIYTIKNCEPFDSNLYVPYRLHLNYLPTGQGLTVHLDSNHMLFKKDYIKVRLISLTFYAETVPEGCGGELYSINGFVYRPIENTAIGINGSQTKHGITQNISDSSRLAFTMRWAHIDDFFLPGHPSKHLWNVEI